MLSDYLPILVLFLIALFMQLQSSLLAALRKLGAVVLFLGDDLYPVRH